MGPWQSTAMAMGSDSSFGQQTPPSGNDSSGNAELEGVVRVQQALLALEQIVRRWWRSAGVRDSVGNGDNTVRDEEQGGLEQEEQIVIGQRRGFPRNSYGV